MTTVYPLIQIITRLSALPFAPWESCALSLVHDIRPSSVSFLCNSGDYCPVNTLYKVLKVPSQTILGRPTHQLPHFSRTSLVFLVDEDLVTWDSETVRKYRLGGSNDFMLVVVAHMRHSWDDDLKSMEDLFAAMWRSGIAKCAVLLVNDTSSQFYTYIPFKNNATCEDTSPVFLGDCSEGIDKAFGSYKILNFNKCPIRITLSDERPFFHFPTSGRMGPLIEEIAIRMNASIEAMLPLSEPKGACGPKEFTGTREMVWKGYAHLALGSFNRKACSTLEYISLAYTQCMSWCTPVLSESDYVFVFVVKQLRPKVWIALILSIVLVSFSAVILSSVAFEHWTPNNTFNLALSIYGSPPPLQPRTTPVRVLVAMWLFTCLVVRTAYESEMKGQSAVQLDTHILYTEEELLEETDLQLCSTHTNLRLLRDSGETVTQQIYRKTKICNGSFFNNMAAAATKKDRAIFTSDLRCSITSAYLSKNQHALLYSRTGGCFKQYQVSTIVTLPGSPFKAKWGELQDIFSQAGLIEKWLDVKPRRRRPGGARTFSMKRLLPALFVLAVGCLISLLLFAMEVTSRAWAKVLLKRIPKWGILQKKEKKAVNISNHEKRPTLWTRGYNKYFF